MSGLRELALGSAPVFGGVMLAVAAGQFKGTDFRGQLKQDMDLLDRLPADAPQRADLERTINERIGDLVDAADRSRALRKAAMSYQGNWRDIVLLLCALLFTIIWWEVSHSRSNWLPTFILLIVLSVVAAAYTVRGAVRSAMSLARKRHRGQSHEPASG
ncbi:hypothetical protein B1T45_00120 [Mycobacterium kansasii]|uniref:Transmembrane protein n=4 Tax=Mycobacterium kansasii TaxID=1768 RepID=A0A1V3X3I9_MYCKA|nr:hypothetical protein MKAN_29035 [Mycobacterium kansasii ATCC 12478]ARG54537.1 hypothetical protein B1T43_00095 [Mycobacterium kansasii]ETZ99334.1 hypothetical protein I547_5404 [Mycobacterium kansasii 824]EUA17031.1 hypothetical protein I545_3795 [Mycobacterium kansasii 662]ARG59985.1 hypothetical protein B1T45_00120 [Mycobacterium kansasii]